MVLKKGEQIFPGLEDEVALEQAKGTVSNLVDAIVELVTNSDDSYSIIEQDGGTPSGKIEIYVKKLKGGKMQDDTHKNISCDKKILKIFPNGSRLNFQKEEILNLSGLLQTILEQNMEIAELLATISGNNYLMLVNITSKHNIIHRLLMTHLREMIMEENEKLKKLLSQLTERMK